MKSKLLFLLSGIFFINFSNTTLAQTPSLSIDKQLVSITGGNNNGLADFVGDRLNYNITVTITGNVTLTNVTIVDPLTGLNFNIGTMTPGSVTVFGTIYTLTQADLDGAGNAGFDFDIDNTATADSDQTGPVSDNVTVPLVFNPVLAIDKQFVNVTGGDGDAIADAVGDVLHYSVTVSNTGNVTLTGVTVIDPLTGMTISGVTLAPGASQTFNSSYTLTQADLDGGGNAGSDYDIDNTATADSNQTGQVSDNVTVPLIVTADLSITKSDGVTTVTAGDGIIRTYTITVINLGPLQASSVVVNDTWPVGFVQGTLTPSQGTTNAAGGNFTWNIGSIAPGGSATLTVSYTVPSTTNAGTQTNTATVSSSTPDPNSGNNTASDTNTVATSANLSITKSDGVTTVTAGDGVIRTYTITVINLGPSQASSVVVNDTWPAGFNQTVVTVVPIATFHNGQPDGSFTTTYSSIAPGQSVTITAAYTVPSTTNSGLLTNTVTVSSSTPDPTPGNNTASDVNTVVENVALTIDKEFQDASVIAGTVGHTFTIVVTNTGVSDADFVSVSDFVNAGLEVTGVSANLGGTGSEPLPNLVNANLQHLAPGQSWTITVTYSVPISTPTSTISNWAYADCVEVPNPVNDMDVVNVINNTICPNGKGYWKNHPEAWPASAIPMRLGNVLYSQAQLVAILNLPVGNGNGNGNGADASIILAQQLIAAKLNIAMGVDHNTIDQFIDQANVLLAVYNGLLPYKVKPNTPAGQAMLALANYLEYFNSGQLTVGCFMPSFVSNSNLSSPMEVVDPIQQKFVLEQNKPNPANNITRISYQLPVNKDNKDYHVSLQVYDMFGREVTTLVNAVQSAGYKSVQFDVSRLQSGIYFYRLTAGSYTETKKMIVVK